MRIDLKRLRQIVAISEYASFSRAADALGISQPALSRSINLIEEWVGARLFDRNRGSVKPTAVGLRLIAGARQLLGDATTLEHNLNVWARSEVGSVTFGIGVLPAAFILSDLLVSAVSREPRLVLEPIIAPAPHLLTQLIADEIEVLICPSKVLEGVDRLKTMTIMDLSFGLFARTKHPLSLQAVRSMQDLNRFPIIASRYINQESNFYIPDLTANILCDDFNANKEVLIESDALWFCAHELLGDEIATGLVEELEMPSLKAFAPSDITLVIKDDRDPSPSVQVIIDAATSAAEKHQSREAVTLHRTITS